jgi:regulatory protein
MKTLRQRALDLLARRDYSRHELMCRLQQDNNQAELIALLDELTTKGWQSDERFAQEYVRTHVAKYGKQYLLQFLAQHKINKEFLKEINWGDERHLALIQWQKKFGHLPCNPKEKAQQARFLMARGFNRSLVMSIVNQKQVPQDLEDI